MSAPDAKGFDDATLVAERHKNVKAEGRFTAAVKALHPDIVSVYDRDGIPSPTISLLFSLDRPGPYDAGTLAAALVEFARRFTPERGTAVASISADTDRVMTLGYAVDGNRATLSEGAADGERVVLADGTLVDVITAAAHIGKEDAAEREILLAAEMAAGE